MEDQAIYRTHPNYVRIEELQLERQQLQRAIDNQELRQEHVSFKEVGIRLREVKRLLNREYIIRSGL